MFYINYIIQSPPTKNTPTFSAKDMSITYGTKQQFSQDVDTSPSLNEDGIKHVQGIVGTLIYCERAINEKVLAHPQQHWVPTSCSHRKH